RLDALLPPLLKAEDLLPTRFWIGPTPGEALQRSSPAVQRKGHKPIPSLIVRTCGLDRNVEMKRVLARAEPLIKCDGRIVAVIGLDVDDPGAPLPGNLAKMRDEGGRNAPA